MNPSTANGTRRKTKVVSSSPKEEPIIIDYNEKPSSFSISFVFVTTWVVVLTLFMILHAVFHPTPPPITTVTPVVKRTTRSTTFNITASSPKIMEIPTIHPNVQRYTVCCMDEDTTSCDYASGITVKLMRGDMIRIIVRDARSARCIIQWTEA